MTAAEEIRRDGEGRSEARSRAESILRLMRFRFGVLTEAEEIRVRTASMEVLEGWVDRVLVVHSVEELFDFS